MVGSFPEAGYTAIAPGLLSRNRIEVRSSRQHAVKIKQGRLHLKNDQAVLGWKSPWCIPAQPVPIPACYICYQEARVNPKGIHRTGSGNLPCGPSFHLRLLCDWPTLVLASLFSSTPVSGLLLLSNPSSIPQMQIFGLIRSTRPLPCWSHNQTPEPSFPWLPFTIFQTLAFGFTSVRLVICWSETIGWIDI